MVGVRSFVDDADADAARADVAAASETSYPGDGGATAELGAAVAIFGVFVYSIIDDLLKKPAADKKKKKA